MRILTYTLTPKAAALSPEARVRIAAKYTPIAKYFTVHKNIVFCFPSFPESSNHNHNRVYYTPKGDLINV